jgi:hypothetical protein
MVMLGGSTATPGFGVTGTFEIISCCHEGMVMLGGSTTTPGFGVTGTVAIISGFNGSGMIWRLGSTGILSGLRRTPGSGS